MKLTLGCVRLLHALEYNVVEWNSNGLTGSRSAVVVYAAHRQQCVWNLRRCRIGSRVSKESYNSVVWPDISGNSVLHFGIKEKNR